jgi:hypothetical protein
MVYGPQGLPMMLVECKGSTVPITGAVLNQALIYNRSVKAPYLVLTNGMEHFCWKMTDNLSKASALTSIPSFEQLKQA